MSGLIQDGVKLFASGEGRKLHGAKITLYTVSHLGYDESSNFFFNPKYATA